MAIRDWFFDAEGSPADRLYTAADMRAVLGKLQTDGVVARLGAALAVTPTTPESMSVQVAAGAAWIQGGGVELTAPETRAVNPPDPVNPRIDRVMAQLNLTPAVRAGRIYIKPGQPGPQPLPPAPQQDATIWEYPLYQVRANVGAAQITALDLTDERPLVALNTAQAVQNLVINGGFEVAQRGPGPFTGVGGFTFDRWSFGIAGGQSAVIRSIASTVGSAGASAEIAFTHAPGGFLDFSQVFDPADVAQLRGRTITAAIWARSTVAGAARLWLGDGVTAKAGRLIGSAPERLIVTFPVAANATELRLWVRLGVGCVVELNDAILVVGAAPVDYHPLPRSEDVARCLRYYQVAVASARFTATGASQILEAPIPYLAPMAVTPTATLSGGATVNASPGIFGLTARGARFAIVSLAAGDCFSVDRQVILEANP